LWKKENGLKNDKVPNSIHNFILKKKNKRDLRWLRSNVSIFPKNCVFVFNNLHKRDKGAMKM
jgi:hypothetical protein